MNWSCPFCDRAQVVTDKARDHAYGDLLCNDRAHDGLRYSLSATRCAACGKISCYVSRSLLRAASQDVSKRWEAVGDYNFVRLIPPSSAKPQPDFIPAALRADYQEACLIRDLSPKASATLSRRCLQRMIRDFCGISKGRLLDEIKELEHRVNSGQAPAGVTIETVNAIDQVRTLGNIGAHMEKDVNLIIDVEPKEAQLMIELVEMLFKDWYVARHDRQERLAKLKATAEAKKQAKAPAKEGGSTVLTHAPENRSG
jgi:hypothetical protein